MQPEAVSRNQESGAPDVVCFCGQDWWYHNRAHSDFQLMRRIARERRVLLVNSIGMRVPTPGRSTRVWRKILRKLGSLAKFVRQPIPELPRFWVMTPLSIPVFSVPMLGGMAAWLVRVQVRIVAWWLGIRRPVLFVTVPTAWEVIQGMPRTGLIYNRSDLHSAFPEANQDYIRQLEQQLLHCADHVLYVSRKLMAAEQALCGDRAVFLDHGVDLELFSPEPGSIAPEMEAIPRPRVGFFGGLRRDIVDFDLLERVALELPDCHLVLVGDTPSDISRLTGLSNVHWLGPKDQADVPRYGRGFDVALMPYRRTKWIQACNPIKLKEYLALGLPVVSTDFPVAREYEDSVLVASSADDFVAKVREAAGRPEQDTAAREARRQRVAGSSWDSKAARVMALCGRER